MVGMCLSLCVQTNRGLLLFAGQVLAALGTCLMSLEAFESAS